MSAPNDRAPSQSFQDQTTRRIWIDMAVFQVGMLWLADWTPRTVVLTSLSLLTAVVYLLWSWNLTGPRRHRRARLLLGSSVVVAVAPQLVAPQSDVNFDLIQVLLLIGAGLFASQTSHIVAGRAKT